MKAKNLEFDHDDPIAFATYERATDGARVKESRISNNCFIDYCLLGPGRSLKLLFESYQTRKATDPYFKAPVRKVAKLNQLSMRFGWPERAKRYDEIQRQKMLDADSEFWIAARRQVPYMDYMQASKLRELADATLAKLKDFVDHTEKVEGDAAKGTLVKIVREKVDLGNVIEAIKLASQLQRLAAGLDKSQSGVVTNFAISLEDLPTEYLDRIIAGEPESQVIGDYVRLISTKIHELNELPAGPLPASEAIINE